MAETIFLSVWDFIFILHLYLGAKKRNVEVLFSEEVNLPKNPGDADSSVLLSPWYIWQASKASLTGYKKIKGNENF